MKLFNRTHYSDPMTDEITDEMIDAQTTPMSLNQSYQLWTQLNQINKDDISD